MGGGGAYYAVLDAEPGCQAIITRGPRCGAGTITTNQGSIPQGREAKGELVERYFFADEQHTRRVSECDGAESSQCFDC